MGTNGKTILSGRGLVHRDLDKRQLACVAANVVDGLTSIDWSIAQLAIALKVSRQYVDLARKLSPERRQAIIDGRDQMSFVNLLQAAERPLALPKPTANGETDLFDTVRKYGIARTLDACCAIEAAQ
jgi:hypothetical protein